MNYLTIPTICPECGGPLIIKNNNGIETLWCTNTECVGKLLNKITHFCSKKGLDVRGLSEKTLEKLYDYGWLKNIVDVYNLANFKTEWIQKSGFSSVSVNKILSAIEESKNCPLANFIAALGIPLVGKRVADIIVTHVNSYTAFRELINNDFDFCQWEGFGESMSAAIKNYDYTNADILNEKYLNIEVKEETTEETTEKLKDEVICITGKLKMFKSRDELKAFIVKNGGRCVESVTKKTTALICNDSSSSSSKKTAAVRLGLPIFEEEQFMNFFNLDKE